MTTEALLFLSRIFENYLRVFSQLSRVYTSHLENTAVICLMKIHRVSMGLYKLHSSRPASLQVMLAAAGSASSYACFIYGTIPGASIVGDNGPVYFTRVRQLQRLVLDPMCNTVTSLLVICFSRGLVGLTRFSMYVQEQTSRSL